MANAQPSFTHLTFLSAIGRQKPFTMRSQEASADCPFCDRSLLPPILKEDGDILLVPNKYPVLQESDPFVLIETQECDSELSLYPEDRLIRVFRMGYDFWRDLIASHTYRSVMFIKNHGPMSGGSLRHPHMQIIALHHIDFHPSINPAQFAGPVIYQSAGVSLNISDQPRVGLAEFNVALTDEKAFSSFCILIQKTVQFILRHYHEGRIDSYNLFFYDWEGVTYCKIMPRGVTTPVFVGYSIPQVTDELDGIISSFQKLFLL